MGKRFCTCGAVVDGACDRCRRTKQSVSTTERGYDHEWRLMSERLRRIHPLCQDCLDRGVVTPSVECHHVVKIIDAPQLRLDPSNIVTICRKCHQKRHEKDSI